ncbi:MAG TPA: rRNA maturation RNase YbeY [Ilumatobacteraceae bacterium]|nr:rRNA maturation RNase YbeY [Ilumatobacteraceae bacterium]
MGDISRPRSAAPKRVGGDGEPEVFCADEQTAVAVDLDRWQRLATAVLLDEGVRGLAELALLFVTEVEITELNESYMGKQGPTDVLSFPIDASEAEIVLTNQPPSRGPDRSPPDPGDMPLLLGDVVICPAVAAAQAPQHAGNLDDELALLVVHGVLHVLGHDHDEPDAQALMRARELELLQAHHWGGPAPEGFRQDHDE